MLRSKISEKVYYTGVNDRETERFEGLWPLPFGVSYNSYLIKGEEKTALVDGVKNSYGVRQSEEIENLLEGRNPDYLIVNHMEPDHSGDINYLLLKFPDMKVVGNPLTKNMLKGYYGLKDEDILVIKDGDKLSLGENTTLSFHTVPMVHWPETMATLLEEEKVIFSGDAFGCFGALNGAVMDQDMDTDMFFPEMLRYYSNIVGKYGQFVQLALKKLGGLELDYICPTHGPVWKEKKGEVIDLYNKLSLYEPLDNGVALIYGSMYGNTLQMAEAIAEGLSESGVRTIEMFNVSKSETSDIIAGVFRHRGLVVCAPTYNDSLFPPVRGILQDLALRNIKNREILLAGGYTWSSKALEEMKKILAPLAGVSVTDALDSKYSPDGDTFEKCMEAGRRLAMKLK